MRWSGYTEQRLWWLIKKLHSLSLSVTEKYDLYNDCQLFTKTPLNARLEGTDDSLLWWLRLIEAAMKAYVPYGSRTRSFYIRRSLKNSLFFSKYLANAWPTLRWTSMPPITDLCIFLLHVLSKSSTVSGLLGRGNEEFHFPMKNYSFLKSMNYCILT